MAIRIFKRTTGPTPIVYQGRYGYFTADKLFVHRDDQFEAFTSLTHEEAQSLHDALSAYFSRPSFPGVHGYWSSEKDA